MTFIKKLNEYFDKLKESFNSDVEINWAKKFNKLIGLFSVDEKVYQIDCVDRGNNIWTYKFYLYDNKTNVMSPELTDFNTGKMSVLSTVRKGMIYLIENENPDALIFGALDDSEGRKKLYWRFSKEIEKEHDYKLYTNVEKGNQSFILFKENINLDILMDTFEKIVEDIF
jgi:hypothetical protein